MLYSRWTSFICLLICCALLGFAAYLQISLGLAPCPLCVLQRIMFALLILVFLVGSLYTSSERYGKRLHSIFIIIFSGLGVLLSGKQVWLMMQPPGTVPTCSPTLEYMLQNLPLTQTLKIMLQGSGDCARETWQMFGLTVPQWSLALFLLFMLFGILRFVAAKSDKDK